MADEKQIIKEEMIRSLKDHHNMLFTPGVYEHSIFGKAALMLENSVEVVMCKNCMYWARNVGVSDSPNGICFYNDICTNGEDYCSYGEEEAYK